MVPPEPSISGPSPSNRPFLTAHCVTVTRDAHAVGHEPHDLLIDTYYANAAFTRSGVKGTRRRRTPVASNTALPIAAGTSPRAISAAPEGASSGRLISSISIEAGTEFIFSTG